MSAASQYLQLLWDSGALLLQDEPFTLKSGRTTYVYANHRNMICLPENLQFLADALIEVSNLKWSEPFALSTVDSSVSPYLVAAFSLRGTLPFYNLRSVNREKGLSNEFFSYDRNPSATFNSGLGAVLVDDVVTTMATLNWAATSLEEHNIRVFGAVCLLDRRVGTQKTSMEVVAVATLESALQYGLDNVSLTDEQRRLIDIELPALRKRV
jgi:orotate phosphoribosyltransferase